MDFIRFAYCKECQSIIGQTADGWWFHDEPYRGPEHRAIFIDEYTREDLTDLAYDAVLDAQ